MGKTADTAKYESNNFIKKLLIQRFQREVADLVKSTQASLILEIGCGQGYLLKFIHDQVKDCRLEAFDISEEFIAMTKEKVPSANLSVQDIYKSGYSSGSFDLVLCSEVLEHLEYPEKALEEIRRLTRRWAVLSVPNEPLFSLSCFLSGKDIKTFGNNPGHINRWKEMDFAELIKKYFSIRKVIRPFPWLILLCEV